MDRVEIGFLGVAVTIVLILIRVPVGVVLATVGFIGITLLSSLRASWSIASHVPFELIGDWNLSAVPMFLLMGYIASEAGLTKGLFQAARIFMGRVPGGLASSTVVASALFSAASGSSVATAASFSRIAIPEMLAARYDRGLACGCVAASGTLGALIPPSILFILFGIFAEVSIGKLFLAGILPGLLSAAVFILLITVRVLWTPALAPRITMNVTRAEKLAALRDIWPLPLLILLVIGSIFLGIVTPTEAGALGALIALMIALLRGGLTFGIFSRAVLDTIAGTASIFVVIVGASIFARFVALSGMAGALTDLMGFALERPVLLIVLTSLIYIFLGMFLESVSLMLLTLPLLLPLYQVAGIDLIWFGVICVKLLEIGLVTPPVGLNVYVIKGALGDRVALGEIFRGTAWFLAADLVTLALLIAFPVISLWLPMLSN
ncbi:TRAP transporter, DctM subunit [Gemmobacter megaterium]|uniref:TRAP transporter large permease protein n=1 Tax=Gemmobacter megaterium TaxID=1086013 RepID=A0A1N7N436_9RHOB|nr:TRAP transporter large permease subunit [Gemmobacter megaterium]GGE12943.1 C4-dicarboxylate ABC transporter [Gemmobacter megaterium]SIS93090.1 TRAP transporter, DctM subunit [Gemmobacter megaterium]